jgi:arylsulfatase A-like enzyme
MRRGNLKIVRSADAEPWQLFDLSRDISESRDLAAEKPALVKSLTGEYEAWLASVAADPGRSKSSRE